MRDPDVEGLVEDVLTRADEAEAMYRSLVELVPAITYCEGLDTRRTFSISPQIESILGFTPEEWLGEASRWENCLHPDDKERVIAACAQANVDRTTWREDYRLIARDGHTVWIHDQAVLVRGSNGHPLCWQGVMVDVSAQRQAASAETPRSEPLPAPDAVATPARN
jgi:PAS domain S-box-containing protein